ncbi:MAG TPA: hypothetical protein VMH80_04430 [Bryobacteraceae bacterium]|nr:hypothetical protein [Bryobacteraceae bacterium]
MFDTYQKSTGREYTATVAWLAIAVIFIPAVVLAVHPRFLSLLLALVGSLGCVIMSWVSWTRSSNLTIPSLTLQRKGTK